VATATPDIRPKPGGATIDTASRQQQPLATSVLGAAPPRG